MNAVEKIKAANAAAVSIISQFVAGAAATPDAVAARKLELLAELPDFTTMDKKVDLQAACATFMTRINELSDLVVKLEAPKQEGGIKIEAIAQAILESPACACLTYEQIAGMITGAVAESKTSSKSIASYVSKHKDTWHVAPREKIKLDMASLLAVIGHTPASLVAEAEADHHDEQQVVNQ